MVPRREVRKTLNIGWENGGQGEVHSLQEQIFSKGNRQVQKND